MGRQVRVSVAAIGGQIVQQALPGVVVPANGIITVDSSNIAALLAAGATYVNSSFGRQLISPAPRVASAGRLVASVALANGTLTIANQPDVPRQAALRIDTGTSGITAGNVALTYVANDGTVQVDNISAVLPASTLATTNTSKGVVQMNSAIVTGLVGGASPLVQLNDTNSLSVMVDPGFVDFAVVAEVDDTAVSTAIGTVASSAASITPTATPNGTHTYLIYYGWNAPDV